MYAVVSLLIFTGLSKVCSVLSCSLPDLYPILVMFCLYSPPVLYQFGQGKRPSLLAFPDGANTFPMRGSIVWVSWLFSGSRKSVSIRCGGSVVVRGGGVGVGCFSVV